LRRPRKPSSVRGGLFPLLRPTHPGTSISARRSVGHRYPSIREYAERKLAKLGKQLAEQTDVEVMTFARAVR
jgi:hypothetical protein